MGAQRVAQFAKHLPAFGWRARVVCCDAARRRVARRSDRARVEAEVRERVAAADPQASLLVPTPSLASDGLLDAAWMRVQAREGRAARLLARKTLTAAKLAAGGYSQSWQPCARWAAEEVARGSEIHACVGEHGPDAGLFLGRWFSRAHGVPWVADFRDPILRPFEPWRRRLYRPLARRLVSTASHVVNVTPPWTAADRELFGLPGTCIPNGFDPDEFAPAEIRPPEERFAVSYVGNLVPEQPIELFVEAWADFVRGLPAPERDRVVLVYRGLALDRVQRAVEATGLDRGIDLGGRVGRGRTLELMQRSHLLVLFSAASRDPSKPELAQGLYPGKVFEYFGAQRPILCVPGDDGILDALLAETRTGAIRSSRAAVAAYLAQAFAEFRERGALGYAPDDTAVARYERRPLAGVLAAVLDEVVAGASGRAAAAAATRRGAC